MSIVDRLKPLVIAGNREAINLVMELFSTVKIVNLTDEQVARIVELLKKKE